LTRTRLQAYKARRSLSAPSVASAASSASYSMAKPDLLALEVVEMDRTMEVYTEAACHACMGHLPSLPPPKLGSAA